MKVLGLDIKFKKYYEGRFIDAVIVAYAIIDGRQHYVFISERHVNMIAVAQELKDMSHDKN